MRKSKTHVLHFFDSSFFFLNLLHWTYDWNTYVLIFCFSPNSILRGISLKRLWTYKQSGNVFLMRQGDVLLCKCAKTCKTAVLLPLIEDNCKRLSMRHCPVYWWDWWAAWKDTSANKKVSITVLRNCIISLFELLQFHCDTLPWSSLNYSFCFLSTSTGCHFEWRWSLAARKLEYLGLYHVENSSL